MNCWKMVLFWGNWYSEVSPSQVTARYCPKVDFSRGPQLPVVRQEYKSVWPGSL